MPSHFSRFSSPSGNPENFVSILNINDGRQDSCLSLIHTVTSTFASNVKNGDHGNKWWYSHLTFALTRTERQRSKKNTKASVKCKCTLSWKKYCNDICRVWNFNAFSVQDIWRNLLLQSWKIKWCNKEYCCEIRNGKIWMYGTTVWRQGLSKFRNATSRVKNFVVNFYQTLKL